MKSKFISFLKNLRSDKPSLVLLVLAAVTLATTVLVGVNAKYLKTNVKDKNSVTARDFYFTVDLLGDTYDPSTFSMDIHIYGGESESITFSAQNYFDATHVTKDDVTYSVATTVSDAAYTAYSLTSNGTPVTNGTTFTLVGNAAAEHPYVLNAPQGYKGETKLSVTFTSTVPYAKTLTLNFFLHEGQAPVTYRVEDAPGKPYANLIIMANDPVSQNALEVNWSDINADGNAIQVDSTNDYVINENGEVLGLYQNDPNGSYLVSFKTTMQINELESISVYFFKADPSKDYSTEKTDDGDYVDLSAKGTGSGSAISYLIELTQGGTANE